MSRSVAGRTPLTGPGLTPIQSGGYWDADLGLPLVNGGKTWILAGDVLGSVPHRRIPNAVGLLTINDTVSWEIAEDGLPEPPFPLLGVSTVPSGAIALPGDGVGGALQPVVFMMNVTHWRDGAPGNVSANGLLATGVFDASTGRPRLAPSPVWAATEAVPLVNCAPLVWDGELYLFGTANYRASPVFLAKTNATVAGAAALPAYRWWSGGGGEWGPLEGAAPLLEGPDAAGVGELSAAAMPGPSVVLCFFAFGPASARARRSLGSSAPALACRGAAEPTGPWSAPETIPTSKLPWERPQWFGPYGGYILPENGSALARPGRLRLVLSLWKPYRSFVITAPSLTVYA